MDLDAIHVQFHSEPEIKCHIVPTVPVSQMGVKFCLFLSWHLFHRLPISVSRSLILGPPSPSHCCPSFLVPHASSFCSHLLQWAGREFSERGLEQDAHWNPAGSHNRRLTRVLGTQPYDFTVFLRAQPPPQCPLQIWVCSVLCPPLIPLGLPQCPSSLHFSRKCLSSEFDNNTQTPYLAFPPFNFPATLSHLGLILGPPPMVI